MNLSDQNTQLLGIMLVGILVGLALVTIIGIFFLLNLRNALQQCAKQNQKMQPSMVWLALIPLFSHFWYFKVVTAVADSLEAEYRLRNIPAPEERPGYKVGMAYCILGVATLIQYIGIPGLGQLFGLVGFICWIVYWVRIARYKRELEFHKFQFGTGNPNPYEFPNRFPGQK